MITRERLKELLRYNPDSGEFTRIKDRQGNARAGDIAGTKSGNGYMQISIGGKIYGSHRLAWFYMTGEWPNHIDHINHDRADNRWINLRNVTAKENHKNRVITKRNKSGIVGVCWCNTIEKWLATIHVDGRSHRLGSFRDKFEAICARMSANNKYNFHENHGRT